MTRITLQWLTIFIGGGILLLATGESAVSAIAEQTTSSNSELSILSTTVTSLNSTADQNPSSDQPPHIDGGPPPKQLFNESENVVSKEKTLSENSTEKAELQKEETKAVLNETDSRGTNDTTDGTLSAEDQSSSDMYLSTSEANTAPVSGSYKPEIADDSTTEELKGDDEKEPSTEGIDPKEDNMNSTKDEGKKSGMTEIDSKIDISNKNDTEEKPGTEDTNRASAVTMDTKSSASSKSATKKRSINGTTVGEVTSSVSSVSLDVDTASVELVNPEIVTPGASIETEGHGEVETTEIGHSFVLPTRDSPATEDFHETEPSDATTESDSLERESAASDVVFYNTSEGVILKQPVKVAPERILGFGSGSTSFPMNDITHSEGGHGVRFDPDGMSNDGPQDPDSIVFSVPSSEYSKFAKMSEGPMNFSKLESTTLSEREVNDEVVSEEMSLGKESNESKLSNFGAEQPSVPSTSDPALLSTAHLPESLTSSRLSESPASSHPSDSQTSSHLPESLTASHLPESPTPSHLSESQTESKIPNFPTANPPQEPRTTSHLPEPLIPVHLSESQPAGKLPEPTSTSHLPESLTTSKQTEPPIQNPPIGPSVPSHQANSQTSTHHQDSTRPMTNNGAAEPTLDPVTPRPQIILGAPSLNDHHEMLGDSPISDQHQSSDTENNTVVHQTEQSVIRPVKVKLATASVLPSPTPELLHQNGTVVAGMAVKTSVSVSLPLSKNQSGGVLPPEFDELLKNSSLVIVPGNPPTIMLKSPENDSAPATQDPPTTTTIPTEATTSKIRKPKIRVPGVGGNGPRTAPRPFSPSLRRPTTPAGPPVSIFGKSRTRANSITSSTTARPFRPYSGVPIQVVHYASHLPPGLLPEGYLISTEPVTEPPPPTTTEEPISEVAFTDATVTPAVSGEDDVTLVKVAGSIALDRGIRWNEQLNNRHSPEFREKSKAMHLNLERLFRSSSIATQLWKIQIDGFSGNKKTRPVLVDFFLYLLKSPEEVPLDLLVTVLHDRLSPNNTFATYRVDTNRTYFERLSEERMLKTTPPPDMEEAEPPIPQWAIAVIVVGAASLIFIVLFAAVTMYGRHHMRYSSKLNEDDLERSSGEWESKMAAAYENMAADTIYDAEDLQADTYKKQHSRIATFHGIPSTLKRCDSWSSNGQRAPRRSHVH